MDTAGIMVPSTSLFDMGEEFRGEMSMEEAGESGMRCGDTESGAS